MNDVIAAMNAEEIEILVRGRERLDQLTKESELTWRRIERNKAEYHHRLRQKGSSEKMVSLRQDTTVAYMHLLRVDKVIEDINKVLATVRGFDDAAKPYSVIVETTWFLDPL